MSKLPGTQIKNRHLTTLTGTDSLDAVFGGNVPNSALIFIDEINTQRYFKEIARCFLAEGILHGHSIFGASTAINQIEEFLNNLPQKNLNYDDSYNDNNQYDQKESNFQIAWRYSTLPKVESSIKTAKNISKFNLSKSMELNAEHLQQECDCNIFKTKKFFTYEELWNELYKILQSEKFLTESTCKDKKFLRIIITDLHSPLWTDPENLIVFLIQLKTFCVNKNCIVLIGLDSSLIEEEILNQITRISDAFFRLEYTSEEEKKSMNLHQKFDGRFFILKLPTIFSVTPHRPNCLDLVFTLKKTHFDIEIFHLPPAIEDDNDAKKISLKPNCQKIQEEF